MKTYQVTITETLQKTDEVEANYKEKAEELEERKRKTEPEAEY